MHTNIGYATGARRLCASIAVTNALNAVDLLVVLAAPDYQSRLAQNVQQDLEELAGHRVLAVESAGAPWVESIRQGSLPAEVLGKAGSHADGDRVRRSVLAWHDVDSFIGSDDRRFDQMADALCRALRTGNSTPWKPHVLHKAVLIGGKPLMDRVDRLAERAERAGIRFRYILVH